MGSREEKSLHRRQPLIAAAPEMLEVLKEMVGVFIWDDGAHDYMIGDYDVALGLAKSVIAKAEGA